MIVKILENVALLMFFVNVFFFVMIFFNISIIVLLQVAIVRPILTHSFS